MKLWWNPRRYARTEARIRRLELQLAREYRHLKYLAATDPAMRAGHVTLPICDPNEQAAPKKVA